ncbi:MAG: C1 family peptidase [Paludibacteraceae bacterium]|nr:C1 family peptidase [Paludibacteraceae bacterium]
MENDKNTTKEKIRRITSIVVRVLLALFFLLLILSFLKIFWDCRYIRERKAIVEDTGYLYDEEDWDIIPDTVAPYEEDDVFDSLPKAVSLEQFFPPIGNQNPYGTCVVWATGYNLTTALKAIKYHWTAEQLADPANQVSPKDLWMGIESSSKGRGCEGTWYEPTFYVLTTTGAASMEHSPYKNLGNCNGTYYGDSTNVLRSYKHVVSSSGGMPTLDQIRAYISDTIPLVISTHVGDRFMTWSGPSVLNQDTYLQPGQMHAYHAMVISGYDDSKNAFRVRNSWGEEWGDAGSIWVDYDFFMDQFCQAVFMAEK